jgi:hypothetical protein
MVNTHLVEILPDGEATLVSSCPNLNEILPDLQLSGNAALIAGSS